MPPSHQASGNKRPNFILAILYLSWPLLLLLLNLHQARASIGGAATTENVSSLSSSASSSPPPPPPPPPPLPSHSTTSTHPPPPPPPSSAERMNYHYLPGVFEGSYSIPGDIDIGALAITQANTDTPGMTCSKVTDGITYTADTTEAIIFAVDQVNKDPDLLPNVTLGFVLRGVCQESPNVALATSLAFLPRSERVVCDADTNDDDDGGDGDGDGVCSSTRPAMTSHPDYLSDDVIGVVSPDLDKLTTMISSLYSVAQLPFIGTNEVGDELSNKDNHPYFFRMVSPSIYQVRAMLKFISTNGWSYISVLYQEGPYNQKAYESMLKNADDFGICVATSHMLDAFTDYDAVVADLLKYSRARVVVLFVFGSRLRKVLRGVKNNNADGHFVFIGANNIATYSGYNYFGTADDPAIGVFLVDVYYKYAMPFYDYFQQLGVHTNKNPWFGVAIEYLRECSLDTNQTKIRMCDESKSVYVTYRYRTNKVTSWRIDAVLTLAHAVHNLLEERCPNARGKQARACITGPLLREHLKKVSFQGNSGLVQFDENQDLKGKYSIGQLIYDYHDYPFTKQGKWRHMTRKNVAIYDTATENITYLGEPISWSHVNTLKRIVPWNNGSSSSSSLPMDIPESVCSRPCVVGEYKIEKEVPCCWECLRCRDNERLVEGNTSCEGCPILTWPDPESGFTTCTDIPPTYPKLEDTIPIVLVSLASVCLLANFAIFVAYVKYRAERVIKASSRELSLIQILGIFVGYTTVILFQTTPTDATCTAIFFLFCMSFALLYCPLLVKTVRIVRIFRSGAKNEKPRFINATPQLVFAAFLIAVQIAMCAAVYILFYPKSQRTQPIWSKKMVELSCDLTFPGLASFLGYNLVLVSMCSIFAFMVRKLPDNFNESKFISMCVSTTLLIWLAFIPTYFTADREYIRAFLLCMALLLNHAVAMALLFAPKIYAVNFVSPEEMTFSNKRS